MDIFQLGIVLFWNYTTFSPLVFEIYRLAFGLLVTAVLELIVYKLETYHVLKLKIFIVTFNSTISHLSTRRR